MATDLPEELLQKLDALKLELEDGDITEKGYEKKRSNLLQRYEREQPKEEVVDLGPEPSAADVIDFLDYLPSPTHSPPKPASGAQFMAQNAASSSSSSSSSASSAPVGPRTSSIQPVAATTPSYSQQQHVQPVQQQQPMQQQQYYSQAHPQQQQAYYQQQQQGYDYQYYARPRPAYGARPLPPPQQGAYPAYYASPPPQRTYARPMPGYQPQQQQMYASPSPRPMYRAPPPQQRMNGQTNAYYRSAPMQPPQGYVGRSPTLDSRVPYNGYTGPNGQISRSATQHSTGRYA